MSFGSNRSSACARDRGASGAHTPTAAREQPSLGDELHPAGDRVDRDHAQLRVATDYRCQDIGDSADDGNAVSEQQRPLVAELRTAPEGDDELSRGCIMVAVRRNLLCISNLDYH